MHARVKLVWLGHAAMHGSPTRALGSLLWPPRGFKALKQLVKLNYKLNKFDKMMESYK